MFEKRPLWALIVGLNVCILIWLISVQEPVMFDVNTAAISSAGSSGNNFIINSAAAALTGQDQSIKGGGGGGGGVNSWGRDLLSHHKTPRQSNEYMDDGLLQGDDSTLTTLNMRNIIKQNNNNNNSYITSNLTIVTMTTTTTTTTTTTKTNDLSSDMQSLTSSLGTGTLAWQTKPTPSWSTIMTAAAASALPDEDFNHLIDLNDFQFLLPQPVCGNHIEALILIHSAPKNYEKRQIIRETWASITHHMIESPLRVLFLLGAVTNDELQQDLQKENNVYRDIVQGSFIDDYRNMTYKHIMAFKWFLYNCPQAQILIKVDDDVYVNTPQLIKYLKEQQLRTETEQVNLNEMKNKPTIATTKKTTPNANTTTTTTTNTNNSNSNTSFAAKATSLLQTLNIFSSLTTMDSESESSSSPSLAQFNASQELFNHPQNLLFCQKIIGSLVKRSYRSKWRVSFKEYSEHYYPPYCPGYAIIYSPDIIFRLYTAAQRSKYFWIDDVHITGVLAQKTNTTITTSTHYILYSDECDQILTGKTDLSKMEFLFAWHSISAQKIKLLWHLQMMSLQTLDDLQYKSKATTSYNGVLYEKQQQQLKQQHQQELKLKQKQNVENSITSSSLPSLSSLSSVRHTSSNGLR